MYMHYEEPPIAALRWNLVMMLPILQQQWSCREGKNTWIEWRDVPTVEEDRHIKIPTSSETLD